MKRLQRLPLLLVLCVAIAAPVACGDDDGTGPGLSDLAGTWTIVRARDCDFDSGMGDWGTFTIQANGAYVISIDGFTDGGTISVSGNTMTITSSDGSVDTVTFTLSGDTLTISDRTDPDCPAVLTLLRQ